MPSKSKIKIYVDEHEAFVFVFYKDFGNKIDSFNPSYGICRISVNRNDQYYIMYMSDVNCFYSDYQKAKCFKNKENAIRFFRKFSKKKIYEYKTQVMDYLKLRWDKLK